MKHYIIFTLFVFIIACQPTAEIPVEASLINQTWIFKDIDYAEHTSYSPTIKESFLKNNYYLHLFPKDIVVAVSGDEYLLGKYEYLENDRTLEIFFAQTSLPDQVANDFSGIAVLHEDMLFENLKMTKDEESVVVNGDIENIGQVTLRAYGKITDNFESHPFYPDNNLWRFKPAEAETATEIKKRLLNHISHQKLLYQHTLQDPKYFMSTVHSKGPLQHYKGSIGVKEFKKIPAQWYLTYWTHEEAAQSVGLLRTYLGNKVIRGKTGDDWKQSNYEILSNLEAKIQEDIR